MSFERAIPDICSGCHITFKLTLKKEDGTPVNIDGANLIFTLKKKLSDKDDVGTVKTVPQSETDINDPQGIAYMPLTDSDTDLIPGKYEFRFILVTKEGIKQHIAPVRGVHEPTVEVYL